MDLPRTAIGPEGPKASRGALVPLFLRKHSNIVILWEFGGSGPLSPSGSAHE